jgi:ribonuclease Y
VSPILLGVCVAAAVFLVLLAALAVRRRVTLLRRQLAANETALRDMTDTLRASEADLAQREAALALRGEEIDRQEGELLRRGDVARETTAVQRGLEKELVRRQAELDAMRREVEAREAAVRERLAQTAGLSVDDARRQLLDALERDLEAEKARRVAAAADATREEVEHRARDIVLTAVQRLALQHGRAGTVSHVALASNDLKGRIIGKEGRNVRAFEAASGCEVVVDETPERVTISGFDPVRREIAVRAMRRLVDDGRIQPSRIEDVIEEERGRMADTLLEEGAEAARRAGVPNVSSELVALLGRLRYRTSYGQNVLDHAVEVARLAGMMAAELALDVATAQRAGLFHDVGKAVDHEEEGAHHDVGARVLRRLGEPDVVADAVADSHEEGLGRSPYAVLVQVADGISAARPGARREDLERFLQRMRELEALATSFPGVERAYALRAGRDLRVLVDAAAVGDDRAPQLARDIARAVEADLAYPGEVKVTVLRETRAVDIAR